MELYILAGIAYFLMLILVLLFFSGASILNEDYDETTNAACRTNVLPDANAAGTSADLQPAANARGISPDPDQAVAVGRQAVALDNRAVRSEIDSWPR